MSPTGDYLIVAYRSERGSYKVITKDIIINAESILLISEAVKALVGGK